ncbi:MAG: S41 family peptidase [Gemmatimonadota bacterium]|nr:S41 family peptidase [Gemmatimonadota bacterium]
MRSRAIVTLAVLAAALVSGGWLLERGFSRGGSEVTRAHLFDQVFAHVQRDFVDTLSADAIYSKATEGMMRELHDPYSTYLTTDRARRFSETTSGFYGGVGIQVDVRNDAVIVITPMPGTPAERAGILAGDRIVSIDGKSTAGWTFDDAVKSLRGLKGTKLTLLVERAGVGERLPFTLVRDEIHVSSVRLPEMLNARVGYVALTIFSDSSAGELRRAIETLRARGMKTLVLDLRSNPGGLLEQGVQISDLFLDPGQRIVSIRGRSSGSSHEFSDQSPQPWPDLSLVVLVNESSASASEIVAGALQDHDRAVLIGNTTYGKGSAQSVWTFNEGSALKLTTARWFTPAGRSIQRKHPATAPADDEDNADSLAAPAEKRAAYRTDGGRTVLGGGGIMPDVVLARADSVSADLALSRALGKAIPKYRDALAEYAIALRASKTITSPDFVPTQAMREELWNRMRAHGVTIARAVYDSAHALVTRSLSDEITRYIFGPDRALARRLRDDRAIAAALELTADASTERQLLDRAAARHRIKIEGATTSR